MAEKKENPVRKKVTKKITANERPNELSVSVQIVKYCS